VHAPLTTGEAARSHAHSRRRTVCTHTPLEPWETRWRDGQKDSELMVDGKKEKKKPRSVRLGFAVVVKVTGPVGGKRGPTHTYTHTHTRTHIEEANGK